MVGHFWQWAHFFSGGGGLNKPDFVGKVLAHFTEIVFCMFEGTNVELGDVGIDMFFF